MYRVMGEKLSRREILLLSGLDLAKTVLIRIHAKLGKRGKSAHVLYISSRYYLPNALDLTL